MNRESTACLCWISWFWIGMLCCFLFSQPRWHFFCRCVPMSLHGWNGHHFNVGNPKLPFGPIKMGILGMVHGSTSFRNGSWILPHFVWPHVLARRLQKPTCVQIAAVVPQFWSSDNSGVVLPGMTTSAVHNSQSQRSSEKMPSSPSQSMSQNAFTSWYSLLRSWKKRLQMIMDHVGMSMETPSSSQLHQQETPKQCGGVESQRTRYQQE